MTSDRPFGGRLEPGDEVHFASLLDDQGAVLATIPFAAPLTVPAGAEASIDVTVHLTLKTSS